MTLVRIQLSRAKGWRKPENTIVVSRPGRYGNPFRLVDREGEPLILDATGHRYCADERMAWDTAHQRMVDLYRAWQEHPERFPNQPAPPSIDTLRAHNLACWCRLCPIHAAGRPINTLCPDCMPCHADAMLDLANR